MLPWQPTSVVPDDGLVTRGEHPHHDSAVLGAGHHVAVLVEIALWPRDHRDNVVVDVHHLQDLGCGRGKSNVWNKMSLDLGKLGLTHVRKVSSLISLCSPHRLIRDDTFRLNWIFI